MIFLTVRRAGNFTIARPARETLFTVVSREDKYKAKNFIDTVVYRSGDQIWGVVISGFGVPGIGSDRSFVCRGANRRRLAGRESLAGKRTKRHRA
jgi:hypothetical protein